MVVHHVPLELVCLKLTTSVAGIVYKWQRSRTSQNEHPSYLAVRRLSRALGWHRMYCMYIFLFCFPNNPAETTNCARYRRNYDHVPNKGYITSRPLLAHTLDKNHYALQPTPVQTNTSSFKKYPADHNIYRHARASRSVGAALPQVTHAGRLKLSVCSLHLHVGLEVIRCTTDVGLKVKVCASFSLADLREARKYCSTASVMLITSVQH